MISWFKQNTSTLSLLVAISCLYFLLRLPNLTLQPIFADEAIYIRWAQVMRAEPTLRFLPMIDGKTPLFMWSIIPVLKLFNDPLFAGRFLSVVSGFVTLLGATFLGYRFFNVKVGVLSAFLVTIVPFMVFFDRMALVDSMLAAFSVWALNVALLLIQYRRLDLAMILGYILGGGILTKTPGFINIAILPTTLLSFKWRLKNQQKTLLKILGLWLVAIIIALGSYNILRLGPGFFNLSIRNQDYMFSPFEVIQRPFDPFLPHLGILIDWLVRFITTPILILIVSGLFISTLKKNRIVWVILSWSLIPILAQTSILKVFTTRYILFSIPPMLVIASYCLAEITSILKIRKIILWAFLLIFMLPLPLHFDYLILTSPEKAPLPENERSGYFETWTAGYGVKEIAQFIENESKKQPVVLGTEGRFGTLPDGIQIYIDHNRQVSIITGSGIISPELRTAAKDHPTYFVSNGSYLSIKDNLGFIKEFPKAEKKVGKRESMMLFKVLP